MTKFQRVKEILIGLLMIGAAVFLLTMPREGYVYIIAGLSVYFLCIGIGTLAYFFLMARFMVGGRIALYKGIILFDLGALAGTLTSVPHYYILIYLILLHAFQGLVRIMRALETRRIGSGSYKVKLAHGILDLVMAILCIVFIKQTATAVLIYCTGLLYSAVLRIISACRKRKFYFIQ